jgi:hypothetical protein
MISWNAVLGCDAYERLLNIPEEAERMRDIRSHHISRMQADGISNSVLDAMPARVPYFCYLGFALGEFGVLPLGGCFSVRWYPVHNVQTRWRERPVDSKLALERVATRIEKKYGVVLKGPPKASLP